ARGHRTSEKAIEASGVPYTLLRPSGFMSNMLNNVQTIKGMGKFFAPAGDGKMGVIHPADIAAVAVKVLTTPGHEGKAYVLTGGETLSNAEQAKILSDAVGKPIEYVNVPPEAAADGMLKGGMPKAYVDMLIEFYGVVRAGFTAVATGDVEKVLGRKPKTYADWAKENAAAFK
ncbi:MAG TPA: NmrA family NAD(P)-binding protein, partial [Myxococcaceae bacterium]